MILVVWFIIAILSLWLALMIVGGLVRLTGTLIVGALAGWLAGKFTRGRGFGVLKNILLGIVGAAVGNILFGLAGFRHTGVIASILTATVGSIVVLYVVRWLQS